jgi:hypothetical protein
MLTGRRLCVCVDLETHFKNCHSTGTAGRSRSQPHTRATACKRVTFSDAWHAVVQWSIRIVVALEATMSRFWAIFFFGNLVCSTSGRNHVSPDHSLLILTLLTKLYRLIYSMPFHHHLSPT